MGGGGNQHKAKAISRMPATVYKYYYKSLGILLFNFYYRRVQSETTTATQTQFNQGSSWSPNEAPNYREQNPQKHAQVQDPAVGWKVKYL